MVAIFGLGACASPDPEQLRDNVELAYAITTGTTEQAINTLPELYPDLSFRRNDFPDITEDFTDCSGTYADGWDPGHVQWGSERQVIIEPKRETQTIGDSLVDFLVDDGWTIKRADDVQWEHEVVLQREGFTIYVRTVNTVGDDHVSYILIQAHSPCIQAPPDYGRDWQWTPGPSTPPWSDLERLRQEQQDS